MQPRSLHGPFFSILLSLALISACADDSADGAQNGQAGSNSVGSGGNSSGSGGSGPGATGGSGAETAGPCGDGVVNVTEQCDGDDLREQTCASLGYQDGTLACSSDCSFDTASCTGAPGIDETIVGYVGDDSGSESLQAILQLSDKSFLVSGSATDLDWLSANVPTVELPIGDIDSASTGNIGFILHVSADLSRVLRAVHFPAGTVRDVNRMRTTNVPGLPTGDLYISGSRDGGTNHDGYYIAKLDGNFLDESPTSLSWSYDVKAPPREAGGSNAGESQYKIRQPWDVAADGSVFFGRGAEFDYNWAAIEKLDGSGKLVPVENWPTKNSIVMKATRYGSMRSATEADYSAQLTDENGKTKQGSYPDDYYFSGPCNETDCAGGPGYTGYQTSGKPTQLVGSIVVDRRSGDLYYGYSTQSVLPGGNPDYEPAVVAMDATGKVKWWARLYQETDQNSSPDQYVDHLAIDYAHDTLAILARSHGNNTYNFWKGNEIADPMGSDGFQREFSGTNGNIHISWLGKIGLDGGNLRAATWLAEPNENAGTNGTAFGADRPHLEGQIDPNQGWLDLNTTRCSAMATAEDGRVAVLCQGRRTLTTNGAHQEAPGAGDDVGQWNSFVRVYSDDLSNVEYSSLLTGTWNWSNGEGGGSTKLHAVSFAIDSVVVVGSQPADPDFGTTVPVAGSLPWGFETGQVGPDALLGHFLLP